MTKLLQDLPAARKASAEAQAKVKAENAKHTPGRWFVAAKGKHVVCTVNTLYKVCADVPPAVDADADASLIAAAPDLLAACQKMAEWEACEKDYSIGFTERINLCAEAFELINAAIAKATGGTK